MKKTVGIFLAAMGLFVAACNISSSAGDQNFNVVPDDESSTSDTGEPDVPEKFDLNTEDAGTYHDPDGIIDSCKKVDFLFVVDNSGSMSDNQLTLIANYPYFAMGVQV